MKNKLFINIMLIISVSIAFTASPSIAAVDKYLMATYNHEKSVAYFIERQRKPRKKIVRMVDWKNNEHLIIKESNDLISNVSLNKDWTKLAYSDLSGVYIYSIQDKILTNNLKITGGSVPYWSNNDSNILSLHDINKKTITEFNTTDNVSKTIKFNGNLWEVKWSASCNCFLYLLDFETEKDAEGHSAAKVHRMVAGEWEKQPIKNKELTTSSDGKYYYTVQAGYELPNLLTIYSHDDKPISSFRTIGPVRGKTPILWSNNRARIMFFGGSITLPEGQLIKDNIYIWSLDNAHPTKLGNREDLAVDPKGFVLMWNRTKKIFEVENINTGKIIKEYKKFW